MLEVIKVEKPHSCAKKNYYILKFTKLIPNLLGKQNYDRSTKNIKSLAEELFSFHSTSSQASNKHQRGIYNFKTWFLDNLDDFGVFDVTVKQPNHGLRYFSMHQHSIIINRQPAKDGTTTTI